jgi:hypothetical protein
MACARAHRVRRVVRTVLSISPGQSLRLRSLAWLALAVAGLAACAARARTEARCDPQPPCPTAIALVVRIGTEDANAPVPGAFVSIREAGGKHDLRTVLCQPEDVSVCRIPGGPGAYDLVVGAPGFDSATARAVVADTTAGACCPSVATQELRIELSRPTRER